MSETLTQPDANSEAAHVDVRPMSVHIGAEIHGLDLREALTPAEVACVRAALLKWKVVFFRNQEMNHEQHVRFSRQFGQPTPGHVVFGGDKEYPEIYSIAKFRAAISKRTALPLRPWTGWHTDITAAINPPFASILRGVTVPPYGGDTQWTNLAAAFNSLSPAMQTWLETLHGEHRFDPPAGSDTSSQYDEVVSKNTLAAIHPIIRVHPETGERALYVSPNFLRNIVELTPHESERIIHMLWEHAILPEYTVRFRWEPGSVAFWDNRATAHLAPRDIFDSDFDRQFYRVTLSGDIPVGVDGQPSKILEGKEIPSL
ncbi:MAG: TauD/TfdA dioxygenase family protein [Burkholderiaceae bacterium]